MLLIEFIFQIISLIVIIVIITSITNIIIKYIYKEILRNINEDKEKNILPNYEEMLNRLNLKIDNLEKKIDKLEKKENV